MNARLFRVALGALLTWNFASAEPTENTHSVSKLFHRIDASDAYGQRLGAMASGPDRARIAARAFAREDWSAAVDAYRRLCAQNPYRGEYWFHLGLAQRELGKCVAAAAALERAYELGTERYWCAYHLACCAAAEGDSDRALDWIERVFASGYGTLGSLLRTDPALDSIRKRERFVQATGIGIPDDLSRDQGWACDIAFLKSQILRFHWNPYARQSPAEFEKRFADLQSHVADQSDDEILVGILQLLTSIGDGHTGLSFSVDTPRVKFMMLPAACTEFSDGLFVTAAPSAYATLLGHKLVAIAGVPVAECLRAVSSVVSRDNDMLLHLDGTGMLCTVQVMRGLGILPSSESIQITTLDGQSQRVETTLEPVRRSTFPQWQRIAGTNGEGTVRRFRRFPYAMCLDEQTRLLYCQYNKCTLAAFDPCPTPMGEVEGLEEFARALGDCLEKMSPRGLVVDLRANMGGNTEANQVLISAIRDWDAKKRAPLFVLIGRMTFSAAMNCATDLERETSALFVGEPTGSKPNFIGESSKIVLPWSELSVGISWAYHQHSSPFDDRVWIAPDIVADRTFEDYLKGRDTALDVIQVYLEKHASAR